MFDGKLKYPLYFSVLTGIVAGFGYLFSGQEGFVELCFAIMVLVNAVLLLSADKVYRHFIDDFWNVILSIGFMLCIHILLFCVAFGIFSGEGCQSNGGPAKFME